MKTINPLAYLPVIAASQIGHHEDGNTNTGSEIAAYQASTTLGVPTPGNGYPWCCAFVCWCIWQFIQRFPGVLSCEAARPRIASVMGFLEWAHESGQKVMAPSEEPQAGDIAIMKFGTGHHIAIVEAPEGSKARTIEGNTSGTETGDQRNGGEVARKLRGQPEIIAYVRLSVKAQAA